MKNSILFTIVFLSFATYSTAQSATTRFGVYDGGGATEYAQYLYIGPGAHVTIAAGQQWVIASQYVFIAPTAVIDGGGQMIIDDPGNFGPLAEAVSWAGQPTTIDGGNSKILAAVVNRNPNNIILGAVNIAPATGDITTANTDHTLYIGTSLAWATTHGDGSALTGNDILPGSNDLKFATAATETGYSYSAFAVTAGTGHVVKESYTGSWVFPVGIAEGDYTPAQVSNSSANSIYVSVQNYSSSAAVEGMPAKGIDRTWNIYADAAATATLALTHNSVANAAGTGTDGSSFDNTAAFVSQQLIAGIWSADSATTNGGTPISTHAGTFTLAASASAATAFFTKSSDIINSVSNVIAVAPVVMLQGAMNGTAMTTTLHTLGLVPKTQPYGTQYSYSGKEKVSTIPAGVTDWVLVELRDAITPTTIVAKRAAFVKSDGTVVDLDGSAAVSFSGVAAGSYYVAVRHRNHLAVRTPASLNLALNGAAVGYNFTTAQAQAYQNAAVTTNAAMKDMGNGVFAMWGGNGANTGAGAGTVRATGAPVINDYSAILTALNGASVLPNVYTATDYNMNGSVRATGAPAINDYTFLLNVLGTNISLTQHL